MACGLCGQAGHRRESCGKSKPDKPDLEPAVAVTPMMAARRRAPIQMRQLSKQERELVFSGIELRYLEAIREMEGGVAYGVPVDGIGAKPLMQSLSKAAEAVGLKLAWAPSARDSSEVFCELVE